MSDTLKALAARIADCNDTWIQPGVLCTRDHCRRPSHPVRVVRGVTVHFDPGRNGKRWVETDDNGQYKPCEDLRPDLNDPATIGVLLFMMPEANLVWQEQMQEWTVETPLTKTGPFHLFAAKNKAAAIARAWLAAHEVAK